MKSENLRKLLVRACALILPIFVLVEVNYPRLAPQSQLALFAMLGVALCLLESRSAERAWKQNLNLVLTVLFLGVGLYLIVQTEPLFAGWWLHGRSLGSRAGAELRIDLLVGILGLGLVLEATRRSIGPALPVLSMLFLAYARFGHVLPDWLLPHRGYGLQRIAAQTFLHSQGVFGVALKVMFSYVFLFVLFGALLEATGATRYIIDASRRLFQRSTGGAAKIGVLSSGLMGSLSGSAVANTATTGTFTIPMMRSSGFAPHLAAGIEAAASSGGALVPPVMGAGAYMMLEIIDPPVSYLQIIRAALLPACLYYLSLFLIVHLYAKRLHAAAPATSERSKTAAVEGSLLRYEGLIFIAGLAALVCFLILGYSVFRAVSLSMAGVVVVSTLHPRTRLSPGRFKDSLVHASQSSVALVCAAACVGIIIGVVTLTGVGTRLPALILPLAQNHLLLALALIMASSIILGMGLPSAVCYLLMATLVGPVLGGLGVVPLAAHLFIFYFGMMSMVTPPVALAAYAASSIAGSSFLRSSNAAFRFALVGFTLPYMFVFRPELLLLGIGEGGAGATRVAVAVVIAVLGILPLAAAIAGFLFRPLGAVARLLLLTSAALSLFPGRSPWLGTWNLSVLNLAGVALLLVTAAWLWARRPGVRPTTDL